MTVYANGIINSSYRYSVALDYIQVGGDVKITGDFNIGGIQNHEDVLALENRLLSIKNEEGQSPIEDISCFYYSAFDLRSGLDTLFLNFSDYLIFLDSSDSYLTTPDLQESLRDIVQFNENTANNQTAILKVSQDYNPTLIKEFFLGATRSYGLQIYDTATQNYTIHFYSTLTLRHLTIFPGFDIKSNSFHSYTVFDLTHLNISDPQTKQFGTDLGYFIDIANGIDTSDPIVQEELGNMLITAFNGSLIDFTIEFSQIDEKHALFTPLLNDSGAFGLIYTSLIYIGGIFALALAVILVNFHQENTHITSILRAQGLSRKYVRRVLTSQLFVIFLLSCGIGGISGSLSAFLFLKIMPIFVWGKTVYPLWNLKLPVFFNFPELFFLLGFIVLFSSSLFLIASKFSTRRNLNSDAHRG
ncbi:MAG: FtsX-like permease family protein [Promethearchaeota archaeon]